MVRIFSSLFCNIVIFAKNDYDHIDLMLKTLYYLPIGFKRKTKIVNTFNKAIWGLLLVHLSICSFILFTLPFFSVLWMFHTAQTNQPRAIINAILSVYNVPPPPKSSQLLFFLQKLDQLSNFEKVRNLYYCSNTLKNYFYENFYKTSKI